MATETGVSTDSPLARVALYSGCIYSEDSIGAERDRKLEKSIRYKMENELLEKLILEIDAAMKAMSTCLPDMEQNVATMKTGKGILIKRIAELITSAKWKAARSAWLRGGFIEIIHLMYSKRALNVEKAVVPYCVIEVSELVSLSTELQRSWQRRGMEVKELGAT